MSIVTHFKKHQERLFYLNNRLFFQELKKSNSKECSEIINRSDQFLEGCYVFQNEWDMEKTNRIVYFPLDQIDWELNPEGDPEWTYMFNRHAFLIDIAVSYRLTQDQRYLLFVKEFILRSIRENKRTMATEWTSWRTIDAALRLTNWIRVFEIISPTVLFNKEELEEVVNSVNEHVNYLEENLSVSRGQSNWLVIELCALFLSMDMFGSLLKSNLNIMNYLAYLNQALELQVEADGLQREQSFMYHHEVLFCLLLISRSAQKNKKSLSPHFYEWSHKLAKASSLIQDSRGYQVAYGDSDIENMQGILEVAEVLNQKSYHVLKDYRLNRRVFGKLLVGNQLNPNTEKESAKLSSVIFPNSGLSILRNKQNSDYTLFKCGPLGGGHGHDDLLHVSLDYQREPILIDSGRYSYEHETHQRLAFKSADAHNTIIVNDTNFNHHNDAWDSVKVATSVNHKFKSMGGYHYTEGGHLGYLPGAWVNRKILYLEEGIWLISDEIKSIQVNKIQTHFHFNLPGLLEKEGSFFYQGETVTMTISDLTRTGQFRQSKCSISPEYNQSYSSQKLIYERLVTGCSSQTYGIKDSKTDRQIVSIPVYGEGKLIDSDYVEGFKITGGQLPTKYVVIQHFEPNFGRRAYLLEDQLIYGKVVVQEVCGNTKMRERFVLA